VGDELGDQASLLILREGARDLWRQGDLDREPLTTTSMPTSPPEAPRGEPVRALTIAEAKQGRAKTFGVPPRGGRNHHARLRTPGSNPGVVTA
jgi:hypothetical protein